MSYYRKPRVENKYNLTIPDIEKLKVADRSLIGSLPFFKRDEGNRRWYITDTSGIEIDKWYRANNRFWIFIYDEGPFASKKFQFSIWVWDDLQRYKFRRFFQKKDVECENDMIIQEKFLETINQLIDLGILNK